MRIKVQPTTDNPFTLALRIPHWSTQTRLELNGEGIQGVRAGSYWEVKREWQSGDTLELEFDFRPHFWVKPPTDETEEMDQDGERVRSTSIYRGPLLLAYDTHHQQTDQEPLPVLDAALLELKEIEDTRWLKPWLLLETTATDGSTLRLCDFASAGMAGTAYESWLPMQNTATPVSFSPTNPLRSQRPPA